MGSTNRCFCYNIHLEVCRGAALEHSEVHLDAHRWKWSYSNMFLHYPLLHPNPSPYTALPLAQTLLLFFQRGWVAAWVPTAHIEIHLYKYKGKVLLVNEKQNFSSPALFSPLTAPSQKKMENTAVTGTLQENKDFPKSQSICGMRKTQGLAAPWPPYQNLKLSPQTFSAFVQTLTRGPKRTVKIYVDILFY